jgi:hypothetical protein
MYGAACIVLMFRTAYSVTPPLIFPDLMGNLILVYCPGRLVPLGLHRCILFGHSSMPFLISFLGVQYILLAPD